MFLESTVVNVALPAIGHEFHLGLDGLQWTVNAYLLTLGALMLLGGALGDRYGRGAVFRVGALGFALTSGLCAAAPSVAVLSGLRFLQGIAGALLVPNSLALIEESFAEEARGTAAGRWAAGSAASTAIGPLVGGAVVSAATWRLVFALVAPCALAAALVLPAGVAAARGRDPRRIDYGGALLATLGLGALVGALINGPRSGFGDPLALGALAAGAALLVAFLGVETLVRHPLLDLSAFRSRAFSGANAATFLVYGALSAALFLLMLVLQNVLGYSALEAGSALLPLNVLLFVLSPGAGRLAARRGPRAPMAAGALLAGCGLALFSGVAAHASYAREVLPAVVVFGLGLALLVAPLTAAVLDSLGAERAGLASGVNNAVARLAGLIATAAIPLAAGLGGLEQVGGAPLVDGFRRAMWIGAGLCAGAAVVAWLTMPGRAVAEAA